MKKLLLTLVGVFIASLGFSQNGGFNGLDMNMGNLSKLSNAKTRSISPENYTGEKGKGAMADPAEDKDKRNVANAADVAQDLGQGWKVNPFIIVEAGETFTMADIEGPGAIQQMWMTPIGNWRFSILRFYCDDETEPSVEAPIGDFFGLGLGEYPLLTSLAICVNAGLRSKMWIPSRCGCIIRSIIRLPMCQPTKGIFMPSTGGLILT